MKTILWTTKVDQAAFKYGIQEVPSGFALICLDEDTKDDLLLKAQNAHYLLASGRLRIDREVLRSAGKLKMVQRIGVGYDTLDLEAMEEVGIPAYVNHGINAVAVAEHTIMLILAALRRLPTIEQNMRQAKWLKYELRDLCRELYNKKVGLIGFGNIGQEVAKRLKGFETEVMYYRRNRLPQEMERELNVRYSPFNTLLATADIVSLHLPYTSETKCILGKEEIKKMKSGTFLINTSRGQLVDEEALIGALKSGHLLGAGLDVFRKEPLPAGSPIMQLENTVITPHVGSGTLDTFLKALRRAFQNIKLFDEGNKAAIQQNLISL